MSAEEYEKRIKTVANVAATVLTSVFFTIMARAIGETDGMLHYFLMLALALAIGFTLAWVLVFIVLSVLCCFLNIHIYILNRRVRVVSDRVRRARIRLANYYRKYPN